MKHNTSSNSINILSIILIFLTFNFNLSAQSKVFTLDEAINMAINNNKDIKPTMLSNKKLK